MIRVSKMAGTYYGADISRLDEDEIEDIEALVYEGTPVLIAETYEDAADMLGIDVDDIN